MNKIIRYQIADYLNTSKSGSDNYALMGAGFSALDENPSAQVDKTAYISDRSVSGTIIGYENSFAFDTQFIADDEAIRFIYDIARNQKTGGEAEAEYVRVEAFDNEGGTSYPARKFRVAVEVTGITGAATEIMRVAGTLHQVGNFVDGTFDIQSKTFTANE